MRKSKPVKKSSIVWVRMTPERSAQLSVWCQRAQMTKAEFMRELFRFYGKDYAKRLDVWSKDDDI